ncbi:thiol reductant ABC exporter subunit CydC [Ktedonobacteria bacterium brp13]|nr:thiol reductant ABC exporter subunit CydC [Ktedonobacteria bacterium brp13]
MSTTFQRLVKLAAPVGGTMALAALLGSCTILSSVGLLATSAYLISMAALHPSVAVLQVAIVGVRFFGIARGIFRYLERLVSHTATFKLLANLRVWFYNALEPLIPARLLQYKHGEISELRSGDILRRAISDIDELQQFYLRVLAPPAVALIIGICMWIFFGAFGGIFALIYIVSFIISAILVPLFAHLLGRRSGREMVTTRAALQTMLVDSVQGIADLVAFGQEERQAQQIAVLNKRTKVLQMMTAYVSGLEGSITNLLMNGTAWVLLFSAIPLVYEHRLNGILLAVLVLAALSAFEAVMPLPNAFQQLSGNLESARRLFEIVDAQPAVTNPGTPSPEPQDQSIQVEHLTFRYNEDEPDVLQDVTFALPPNQCLAIVGPSGSGKSTLAQLLLRFWDYQQGEIKLGGYPLKAYQQDDLYTHLSVVEQDTHLFNTSIRENLMLARSDASEEEMIAAAKQAQLHDFVQTLPRGYDTHVGEQGLRLSGGERQRVAIARAFLKDTPILILDEPTVNLDAITERAVMNAINALRNGRTTFLVTHRLVAMETVNEILVLREGRVAERGTHTDLLQKEGLYWKMWQQQRTRTEASI